MRSHLQAAGSALLVLFALAGTSLAVPASAHESESKSTSASRHTWLGVSTQSLDSELRDGLEYRGNGVLVNQVVEGSPAERAGVQQGDVIVSLNGSQIDSPDALQTLVRRAQVGDRVRLEVARKGHRETLTATLAERSTSSVTIRTDTDTDTDAETDGDDDDESTPNIIDLKSLESLKDLKNLGVLPIPGRGRLGVQLQDLDGDLGSYFSVPGGKGALIVEVEKESPAARAGLKSGDVIVKVGDQATEDSDEAARAIREREGKTSITIVRRGQRQIVIAELSPRARIQRIVRGRAPMNMDDMPMLEETYRHHASDLHRQMEQLREEIQQLREELRQKSQN